jgi:Ca2+-binding EF-hand superfamily protein
MWFQRMDRNADGDVSGKEFLGRLKDFQKLDQNQDGLISPEEANRA